MTARTRRTTAATALLALGLAGCATESPGGAGTGADTGLAVSAELYPFAWLASEIGGDLVDVTQLMPAGADVHAFELSARQVDQLARADLAVATAGAAPAVDVALEQHPPRLVIDVADLVPLRYADEHDHHDDEAEHDDHDHDEFDTHTWLALPQLPDVALAIGGGLAELDPGNASTYQANAAAVAVRLSELDAAYAEGLATCESRTFLITHPSFGYLADAYDLEQVGVSGLNEDSEPSPARISEIIKIAQEEDASVVFFPGTSNPKIADVLADELGLEVSHLDELTAADPGTDLIELAEGNLTTLRAALGCS